MASSVPLSVIQGNDVTVDLSVFEEDGATPQDLTGLTPQLLVKDSQYDADATATVFTVGAGLTITNLTLGLLTALLPRTLLAVSTGLWYRLDVADGSGEITTCIYGPLTVTPA